jgi:hypothetical protein
MRKRGREGEPRSLKFIRQLDVAFASSFNNLKIGNTTKIEIEHILESKQIKVNKGPPLPSPYITQSVHQI